MKNPWSIIGSVYIFKQNIEALPITCPFSLTSGNNSSSKVTSFGLKHYGIDCPVDTQDKNPGLIFINLFAQIRFVHTKVKIKGLLKTFLIPFRVPDIIDDDHGMYFTSQNIYQKL